MGLRVLPPCKTDILKSYNSLCNPNQLLFSTPSHLLCEVRLSACTQVITNNLLMTFSNKQAKSQFRNG